METFVVRVWQPSEQEAPQTPALTTVRGFLEHVGSGRSSAFAGTAELEALILAGLRGSNEAADRVPAPWRDPRRDQAP